MIKSSLNNLYIFTAIGACRAEGIGCRSCLYGQEREGDVEGYAIVTGIIL